MKKIVNGVEMDMTDEDMVDYNNRQQAWDDSAPERMVTEFTQSLERVITEKAAEKSYSSAVSCASYKDSTNEQWAAEANAFIAWRDMCFEYAYDYQSQVQQRNIPNPNLEEFLLGLPAMQWPIINP